MLFYICLGFGIVFSIIFLICLVLSIIDRDFEMFPLLFVPLALEIVFIVESISLKEKVGIVCSVEKVQTSYT